MTTAAVASTSPTMPFDLADPTNSGPHTDAVDAAFGVFLAGAQSEDHNRSQPPSDASNADESTSTKPSAEHDSTAHDSTGHEPTADASTAHDPAAHDPAGSTPTRAAAKGSHGSTPPTTQQSGGPISGPLAVPAALPSTPPQPNPTPPAVTDVPPIPTGAAATSTSPPVPATDQADPDPASPAVLSPALPAAPIDAATAAGSPPPPGPAVGSARLNSSNPSPVPVGGAAADNTPAHPSTSIEPTAPAAVDPARSAPYDRPRPQLPFSAPNPGAPTTATTTAAPTPAPTATADAQETTTSGATVTVPPAEQLVAVLTPLRSTTNGTYTLRLELKPPELGRVEMRVEMKDGVLSASIHADHEGSAQLVRDALSDLRDLLNTGGIHTGDLTVSDGGVGPGSRDARDTPSATPTTSPDVGGPSDDPMTVGTIRSDVDPNSTSLLDVRL